MAGDHEGRGAEKTRQYPGERDEQEAVAGAESHGRLPAEENGRQGRRQRRGYGDGEGARRARLAFEQGYRQ